MSFGLLPSFFPSFLPLPVCVCVCMMVTDLIFLWCRNPVLPSHYFECRHVIVGGPLSDKWVLFLVSCESSSFKTIVLIWPISGDSRQLLPCVLVYGRAECQERVSGERRLCCFQGLAPLVCWQDGELFWGSAPRPLFQRVPWPLSVYVLALYPWLQTRGRKKGLKNLSQVSELLLDQTEMCMQSAALEFCVMIHRQTVFQPLPFLVI